MIDLLREKALRLNEIAKLAGTGRTGGPTSTVTVCRWILKGLRDPSGLVVKLEAIRVGGHLVSSAEAFQRFCESLTPRFGDEPAPAPRTPGKRERAVARAKAELAEAGI